MIPVTFIIDPFMVWSGTKGSHLVRYANCSDLPTGVENTADRRVW